ncbi:MAG: hypothetical protein VYA27_05685, partial [Verrucomicrobiota bacterium]|nr:hypothetical protein [Verrucomicrobiota bacterium]
MEEETRMVAARVEEMTDAQAQSGLIERTAASVPRMISMPNPKKGDEARRVELVQKEQEDQVSIGNPIFLVSARMSKEWNELGLPRSWEAQLMATPQHKRPEKLANWMREWAGKFLDGKAAAKEVFKHLFWASEFGDIWGGPVWVDLKQEGCSERLKERLQNIKTVMEADLAASMAAAVDGAQASSGSQDPSPPPPPGGPASPGDTVSLASLVAHRGPTLAGAQAQPTPMMFIGVPAANPQVQAAEHLWGVTLDLKVLMEWRNHPSRRVVGPGGEAVPAPFSRHWVCSATLSQGQVLDKLKAYFEDVRGQAALVWFAGHGSGEGGGSAMEDVARSGDWCLSDGQLTLVDVVGLWADFDKKIPVTDKDYRRGSLTIVSDCCYSGCWPTTAAWHYSEMRGFGGPKSEGVKKTDPSDKCEYWERVCIQSSTGRREPVEDAVFAPGFVQLQLDPTEPAMSPLEGFQRFARRTMRVETDPEGKKKENAKPKMQLPASPIFWAGARHLELRSGDEAFQVTTQPAMMAGVKVAVVGGVPLKFMGNMARAPGKGFEHSNDLKNMR